MRSLSFTYPWVLVLLVLLVPLVVFLFKKEKQRYASVKYSWLKQLANQPKTWSIRLRLLPDILRVVVLVLLIIAIARPHFSLSKDDKSVEGIDIVMALDVSPSMLAEDFKPNRLEAAKKVAKQFIDDRKNDQIGLVIFSGEAFTQCPPTIDHDVLLNILHDTQRGNLQDGTAIGDGLTTAINRLRNSKAKSKVIILITDGVNNVGQMDPLQAASIAKQFNIRVYTIGIGSNGLAPFPVQTPFGKRYEQLPANIDESLLKSIAKTTSAQYFRSTKNSSLENIFKEIDSMEKSIINVSLYSQTKDVGDRFAWAAMWVLLFECVLRYLILKRNY